MSAAFEIEASRPGRLYQASSHISHAVVRSRTRQELLNEVARILVQSGGFAMAFVAWHDPCSQELKPVARFGDNSGYIDRIHIFGDERPEGQGPGGTAFRSGVCYLCQDFLEDSRTLLWREAAIASGWRGSATIPIAIGGKTCGIVAAYACVPWSFGPDELELFEQVATDVSIGLDRLESDEKRRLAEAALATSERRLKLAIDAAAIGIFEWDMITGHIVWDQQGERLFGYAPGGFNGSYSAFADRIHPDDRAGVETIIARAASDRAAFVHEFRIVWPEGSVHWISSRGEFIYDESGRPIRLYGATFDIDDRKRAEEALRESEDRLRQAVRTSGIGIFDHDHIRGTIYWSPEQRAIHGWDANSPATLEVYYSRTHPDDRTRIAEHVRRAHDPAGNGYFDVEHRLLLPDGSIRWTRTRSQTFFGGHGEGCYPVRTVGAVTDITERKRFEEELTKLASVVEMSNEFVGIATLDGVVVYLNKSAMALAGIESLEEAQQKTIFDFFPETDQARAAEELYPALMKTGFWSGESRLRNFRTGMAIDVELSAFHIRDDHANPLYIATVTRDITERRKAEADKALLESSLFEAQKMESIGRLAGGVAHDFNNMLTVINGYSELLKREMNPADPLLTYVKSISDAGERAARLTQQLLAFSRRQVIQPKVVNVNRVVREAESMLKRLIGEDITLISSLTPDVGGVVADPDQLHQVLMNLAANARDAMPYGGTLIIKTSEIILDAGCLRSHPEAREGRFVEITVQDTGFGMDESTTRNIFEPFFTTKERGKGTGLGLATVYGIIHQLDGWIEVESELAVGTVFRIYMPRREENGEAQTEAEAEVEGRSTHVAMAAQGSETILLVEDQEDVRRFAKSALASSGYEVIDAANASEAIALSAQHTGEIDLVITDVVMPGMNGRELVDRLRIHRPGIKILFTSGYTAEVILRRGVNDNIGGFLLKPFNAASLAAKAREILTGPLNQAKN